MTVTATFSVALADETATAHLMADLALLIGPGDVITLSGDLGAGKTTAARALIRYLADDEELEVPSPTFTLAQTYDLRSLPLVHADLYRIGDPSELEEIGLSPLPEATVVLIEWPARGGDRLPPDQVKPPPTASGAGPLNVPLVNENAPESVSPLLPPLFTVPPARPSVERKLRRFMSSG